MDLVAEMLLSNLSARHADEVTAVCLRPHFAARLSRIPTLSVKKASYNADRLLNRFWDYPRWLDSQVQHFDLFHIIDHSYAHLAHRLPPGRVIVTCHDLDTFRCVIQPTQERRSRPFREMTRYILTGLKRAAGLTCDSSAIRDEILSYNLIAPDRLKVVHNGIHPACSPDPNPIADREAAKLLGDEGIYLLHVGSTIPRKRIDVLLEAFASVRRGFPGLRLIRVGGPLSESQTAHAAQLGLTDVILTLPFLDPSILAAVYRKAALLLQPSEREGFGLPILEAMACGTPVLASDISALREVGGSAASFCAVGDVPSWVECISKLLRERSDAPQLWRERRTRSINTAAKFSWSENARLTTDLYRAVALSAETAPQIVG
jgi:glycosyltransferase involved in cell wall biosynthesis